MTATKVLLAAVAAFVLVVVAFFVLLNVLTNDGPADCSHPVKAGEWQRAGGDRRAQIRDSVSDCGQLEGRSEADVQALMGPPDEMQGGRWTWWLAQDTRDTGVRVDFSAGRAVKVQSYYAPPPQSP